MLVLNSISLFYHELSCSTSEKPTGIIEKWTKDVVQRSIAKSGGSKTTPASVTLVSRISNTKAAGSDVPSKSRKKLTKVPTRYLSTSDEEFPPIRLGPDENTPPPVSSITIYILDVHPSYAGKCRCRA